ARVLTEHISSSGLSVCGGDNLSDGQIYARDVNWLVASDAVIAEVSAPSLGVGYEIGMAEALGKPTLCLFNVTDDSRLSAMLSGNPHVAVKPYQELAEAKAAINEFIAAVDSSASKI
ncbi:MAG: nucleoside 2-deoxyribosyltransferase, partial [Kiritimatiellales bacterium]|nr:nucleoside 2-deoxyribosyltransferase [Kiritimatiellales bacterium]